jgi:hypothetical protein
LGYRIIIFGWGINNIMSGGMGNFVFFLFWGGRKGERCGEVFGKRKWILVILIN